MQLDDEKLWEAVATGSAILAAVAVRNLLTRGWKRWKRADPPENPADPAVDWGEAIAWTMATGVAVGLGRLVAKRLAAGAWARVREENPEAEVA